MWWREEECFKDMSYIDMLKIFYFIIGNYFIERELIFIFKVVNDYREGENGYLLLDFVNFYIVFLLCYSRRVVKR